MKIYRYLSEQCGPNLQLRENIDRAQSEKGLKADAEYHTLQL